LVLVGSRASLASANVREEWMHVHAAGKPVVIALFESVDLPTELGAAPTVDFRTNFSAGVTRLAEILRAPTSNISSSDRARRPARSMSGFLPRWSVDVWLLVLAALGIAAVALAVGIMFARDLLASGELYGEAREVILPSIVALFTWLWVLATSAYLAWAVIHRRFKFNDLRIMLCFGWLFLWICGSLAGGLVDFFDHGGPPALALGDPPATYQHLVGELFIPFVAVSLCSWVAAFRTFRSGDLLRWAMTGEAPDGLRARVHASLGAPLSYTAQSRQIEAGDVTFSLYHHPADAGVAREVAIELSPSGLLRPGWRLQQDAGESATPVAILSNFTARDWVTETLGRAGPRPVCVAATSLDLPSDIAWVRRFQWADYRLRSRDQLDSLVGSVRILPVVPESLAKLRAPKRIMAVAYALKFLSALSLASGISDALLTAMDMRDPLNQARAALGIAGGGLMFWLAHRVLARTIAPASLSGFSHRRLDNNPGIPLGGKP
jgi:hypothetical protein